MQPGHDRDDLVAVPTRFSSRFTLAITTTRAQANAAGKNFAASVGCGKGTSDVARRYVPAKISGFAADGKPAAQETPAWPRFNHSDEVMSLQPAGDSELVSTTELRAQHNCAFWDKLAPTPNPNP